MSAAARTNAPTLATSTTGKVMLMVEGGNTPPGDARQQGTLPDGRSGNVATHPATETVVYTTPGAAVMILKIIAGLTNEKLLLIVVVVAFGFMTFSVMNGMSEERATSARRHEEAQLLARQHCDDREDKRDRERKEEARETRTFFAQQAEVQRRHDAERDDKTRTTLSEKFLSIVMELAELRRWLAKKPGD